MVLLDLRLIGINFYILAQERHIMPSQSLLIIKFWKNYCYKYKRVQDEFLQKNVLFRLILKLCETIVPPHIMVQSRIILYI
jgi:hypothetical protein